MKQIVLGAVIGLLIAGVAILSLEFSLYDWGYRHRQELRWLVLLPAVILVQWLWKRADDRRDDKPKL
jgi:hypothetical protein